MATLSGEFIRALTKEWCDDDVPASTALYTLAGYVLAVASPKDERQRDLIGMTRDTIRDLVEGKLSHDEAEDRMDEIRGEAISLGDEDE